MQLHGCCHFSPDAATLGERGEGNPQTRHMEETRHPRKPVDFVTAVKYFLFWKMSIPYDGPCTAVYFIPSLWKWTQTERNHCIRANFLNMHSRMGEIEKTSAKHFRGCGATGILI